MLAATLAIMPNYTGSKVYLILFSLTFFAFLKYSLFDCRYYYQKFIAVFLSLGFWLKLIYYTYNRELNLAEGVGSFNFSAAEYDRVMILSICAILGFLMAGWVYEKFFFEKEQTPELFKMSLQFKAWYIKYRKPLMAVWIVLLCVFAYLNLHHRVYIRGSVEFSGPFWVRGFFSWGLMFGFYSISCIFAYLDYKIRNSFLTAILLLFFTSAICAIAMFSRGFVLNAGSTLLALFFLYKSEKAVSFLKFFLACVAFVVFTVASTKVVTALRFLDFEQKMSADDIYDMNKLTRHMSQSPLVRMLQALLVDRWVGLEGVMRGVAFTGDRAHTFENIWREKMGSGTSYYDINVMNSGYAQRLESIGAKHLFITIPGFVGWISVLNNLVIAFVACFLISVLFMSIEFFARRLTNNIFMLALLGQVMAYRVAHFGYLPQQTYLFLFILLFTICLVFFCLKIVSLSITKLSFSKTTA